MAIWLHRIHGLRDIITKDDVEDGESCKANMGKIAELLKGSAPFSKFQPSLPLNEWGEVEILYHGNGLVSEMYDYADENQIWIEF